MADFTFLDALDGFTNSEKERINQLYGNDFADITPDDALLIARWESAKATAQALYSEQTRLMQEESELRKKQCAEQHEIAMQNLNTQLEMAKARLKAVEDGSK